MDTQQPHFPDGNDALLLSQQLEELGNQLGFYVEGQGAAGLASETETMIKITVIYHMKDAQRWQELFRHLVLLEISGWQIEWSPVRLFSETEVLFKGHIQEQLEQSHLVLLLVSIDLVETLVQKNPGIYALLASLGEKSVVFPILLRPVFWSCSFPTLEPTPQRAISVWGNRHRDAAHTIVAKKLSGILEGIRTFLENDVLEEE